LDEARKYREVAADLERRIDSGELAEESKLPPDSELTSHYGVSRNTVREAVRFLVTRGLVQKRPGEGTVVRKKNPFRTVVSKETGFGGFEGAAYASEAISQNRTPQVTTPKVELQVATGQIAAELELKEGKTVVIRHQQRFIDGELWSIQTSYYPKEFVDRGADDLLAVKDIEGGTRQYLRDKIQVREIGSYDTMRVRAPDPDEAASFKLPDDGSIAVFETRQRGVDAAKTPVRVTITVYPADRNEFRMETGDLADETATGLRG
jgi:GntR family transcriptional regulator